MAVTLQAPPRPARPHRRPRSRRPAWKQWLVRVERGVAAGFRSDSVFFVHLFVGCLAVAAGGLIGLSATEWAVLVLALTVTTASELCHQVLKGLRPVIERNAPEPAARACRLADAAAALTALGSGLAAAILFGSRLWMLFAG